MTPNCTQRPLHKPPWHVLLRHNQPVDRHLTHLPWSSRFIRISNVPISSSSHPFTSSTNMVSRVFNAAQAQTRDEKQPRLSRLRTALTTRAIASARDLPPSYAPRRRHCLSSATGKSASRAPNNLLSLRTGLWGPRIGRAASSPVAFTMHAVMNYAPRTLPCITRPDMCQAQMVASLALTSQKGSSRVATILHGPLSAITLDMHYLILGPVRARSRGM